MTETYPASVVRTKLQPPILGPTVLRRARLDAWLAKISQHRMTLVVSPAGYGKTTALAELTDGRTPLVWYTLSAADGDPVVFLNHLIEALKPSVASLHGLDVDSFAVLAGREGSLDPVLAAIVNALTTRVQPLVVVLDDYHLAGEDRRLAKALNWLIQHSPRQVHYVLSSRLRPRLPVLPRLQADRQVLLLDDNILRFTADEVAALLAARGVAVTEEDVGAIAELTEGWVLGLQLVEQFLSFGGSLSRFGSSHGWARESLFEYLAEEVINKQPFEVRDFMYRSSVLRVITVEALDAVLGAGSNRDWLDFLDERNLFVSRLAPDAMRYHHLMLDFLRARLSRDDSRWKASNAAAARYYESAGRDEVAFEHWLTAGEHDAAATALLRLLPHALRVSRFAAAEGWLTKLPCEVRRRHPVLLLHRAHALHALGKVHSAFQLYTEAADLLRDGGGRQDLAAALRGRATIYREKGLVDKAIRLYTEALTMLAPHDTNGRAEVLGLLGISDASAGDLLGAEDRLQEALALYALYKESGSLDGQYRVWNNLAQVVRLRQGRFAEALEAARTALDLAGQLGSPFYSAEASTTCATVLFLQGEYSEARDLASAGLRIASDLGAVGLMADALVTMGHALRYGNDADRQAAEDAYEEALAKVASGDSQHYLVTEAILGRAFLARARGDYRQALNLSGQAMDGSARRSHAWFLLVSKLEHAASLVLSGQSAAAVSLLEECDIGFAGCGDDYHLAGTALWRGALETDPRRRSERTAVLLDKVSRGGYHALLRREVTAALPLLVEALDLPALRPIAHEALLQLGTAAVPALAERLSGAPAEAKPVIVRLLGELADERARRALKTVVSDKGLKPLAEEALARLRPRPEYTLYLNMLGPMQVFRGGEEVGDKEWRTVRARTLLALLASHRGQYIPKEGIIEVLWPDAAVEAADNNFRFTLSSLNKALEPHRLEGSSPYYIQRKGDSYALSDDADVVIDTEQFEALVRRARNVVRGDGAGRAECVALYKEALTIYRDDYLPEYLYDDWSSLERERLRELYFQAASHLAELLMLEGAYDDVADVARGILRKDSCREDAYRLLMRAHSQRGDRTGAIRAYQACVLSLEDELGVRPLPETEQLYLQIRGMHR